MYIVGAQAQDWYNQVMAAPEAQRKELYDEFSKPKGEPTKGISFPLIISFIFYSNILI